MFQLGLHLYKGTVRALGRNAEDALMWLQRYINAIEAGRDARSGGAVKRSDGGQQGRGGVGTSANASAAMEQVAAAMQTRTAGSSASAAAAVPAAGAGTAGSGAAAQGAAPLTQPPPQQQPSFTATPRRPAATTECASSLSSEAERRANAHLILGYLYVDGEGTRRDNRAAVRHLRAAAELGCAEAQKALGSLYNTGQFGD